MTKPARLLAPVLFCAVFGFAQGANAVTVIGINGTAATLTSQAFMGSFEDR